MSILYAYCQQLHKNIDIVEAELYIANNPNSSELQFYCPNEECRETFHPEIIDVNLYNPKRKKTPHFRIKYDDKHLETCNIQLESSLVEEIIKNQKEYKQYEDATNITFIDDIFMLPYAYDFFDFEPKKTMTNARKVSKNNSKKDNIGILILRPQTTSIFYKIAYSYYKYKEELAELKIKIGKEVIRKYKDIFIFPTKISLYPEFTNIIYSKFTSIKSLTNGYYITFPYEKFISNQKLPIGVFISHNELENNADLKTSLENAKDNFWIYLIANTEIQRTKFDQSELQDWLVLTPKRIDLCIVFPPNIKYSKN